MWGTVAPQPATYPHLQQSNVTVPSHTNKQIIIKMNWSETIESAMPFPVPEICVYWGLSPFSSPDNYWHVIPVLSPNYVLISSPLPSQENEVKGGNPLFTPGDNLLVCPCPLPWYSKYLIPDWTAYHCTIPQYSTTLLLWSVFQTKILCTLPQALYVNSNWLMKMLYKCYKRYIAKSIKTNSAY